MLCEDFMSNGFISGVKMGSGLYPVFLLADLDEALEGTVVAALDVLREGAGWELLHAEVVAYALAAFAFLVAAGVGAVAVGEILRLVGTARHLKFSLFFKY